MMTDETDYFGTPESRDRDARMVGHEIMTDDPKCEAGCISYYGGEKKHHRDCPYYPESLTKLNADRIEALLTERDALEAEAEGAAAIIAAERAEVLKLREQLAALSLRHERTLLQGAENKNKLEKVEEALHEIQAGDMSPYEALDMIRARAISHTPPPPAAMPETPTSSQLHSVCLSLRHDYGLMDREDQEELKLQARECWKAISRALAEQEV